MLLFYNQKQQSMQDFVTIDLIMCKAVKQVLYTMSKSTITTTAACLSSLMQSGTKSGTPASF